MIESVTAQAYEELSGDAYEVQGDNTLHLILHTHKATLAGRSGDIMSRSGRKYFELNAKKLLDQNEKHMFTIKHALVSLHKRMYICDHVGNKLMEIHSENIIQMDASAVLTDLVGKVKENYRVSGSFKDRKYKITNMFRDVEVAEVEYCIDHLANDDTYSLRVKPGENAALMSCICIALEEMLDHVQNN